MPNPFRLTIRWLSTDAFPGCRVVVGDGPPRWNFGLLSSWNIPNVQTSEELAAMLDKIAAKLPYAFSRDQLRVLAVEIRKTLNKLENFMGDDDEGAPYPWRSGGIDPYGDPSLMFQCDYKSKSGEETLLLWLTPIAVIEV